jgi:hypothetical protein
MAAWLAGALEVPGTDEAIVERLGLHDAMLAPAVTHRATGVTLTPAKVAYFQRAAEVDLRVPVWMVKAPPTRPQLSWAAFVRASPQGRGTCS